MTLFVDWQNLSVNEEGAYINFTAQVQVEAVHKCDSIDAADAMVTRLVNQELSDELLTRLEHYLAEQRGDIVKPSIDIAQAERKSPTNDHRFQAAVATMQGMLINSAEYGTIFIEERAELAVAIADTLLEKLNKERK